MLPPRPPSPPSGPPNGTNFSRRKDTTPFPPSPAFTQMRASSMSILMPLGPFWGQLSPRTPVLERGLCGYPQAFDGLPRFIPMPGAYSGERLIPQVVRNDEYAGYPG